MEPVAPTAPRANDWRDEHHWYTHVTPVPKLIKLVTKPALSLAMRVRVIDPANLPDGPCILAANHINNFDVLLIGSYCPRYPFFMAKEELFQNRVLGWIFRLSGTFPVKRGRRDRWAMRQAGRVLAAGQMLTMFPEGTRSGHNAALRRGKPGTVSLALEHGVPIVPLAILGTQNINLGRARPQITVQFGQPFDATARAGSPPHTPETIRELTRLLMQRIAAMLPPEHRGIYG